MRLLSLCLLLAAVPAVAQKPIVLKAAHLFDGKANSLVSPGLVVVADGILGAVFFVLGI